MATHSVHTTTDQPNDFRGSSMAFLDAWREHERLDSDAIDTDSRDYQLAMFAYEGGQDRIAKAHIFGHTDAALAALVAIGRLDLVLAGFFSAGPAIDPDEAAELKRIRTTLTNIWRFHDRNGADPATRDYARYVGAPEKHDLVSWERLNG